MSVLQRSATAAIILTLLASCAANAGEGKALRDVSGQFSATVSLEQAK